MDDLELRNYGAALATRLNTLNIVVQRIITPNMINPNLISLGEWYEITEELNNLANISNEIYYDLKEE